MQREPRNRQSEKKIEIFIDILFLYLHEVGQTLGDVVEKVLSGAYHNALWYGVDFGLHVEMILC